MNCAGVGSRTNALQVFGVGPMKKYIPTLKQLIIALILDLKLCPMSPLRRTSTTRS